MKSLEEYYLGQIEEVTLPLEEESTASSTVTAGVANPDAQPLGKIKRSKVFNHPCFEVDSDTYHKCMKGKEPFSRWANYIDDEDIRAEIKSTYQKSKKVLLKDAKSGSLVYIK